MEPRIYLIASIFSKPKRTMENNDLFIGQTLDYFNESLKYVQITRSRFLNPVKIEKGKIEDIFKDRVI
jgi:hypothetical protein